MCGRWWREVFGVAVAVQRDGGIGEEERPSWWVVAERVGEYCGIDL